MIHDSRSSRRYPSLDHPDKQDALTCALIAHLFQEKPHELAQPDHSVPTSEGWIWVPKDILGDREGAQRLAGAQQGQLHTALAWWGLTVAERPRAACRKSLIAVS
jgi:hypothetical protein